jgi:hypothetical protein
VNGGGASQPAASAHSGVVRTTSRVSLVVSPATLVAGQPRRRMHKQVNASAQSATVVLPGFICSGTKQLSATYQPASGSLVNGSASASQTISVAQDSTSISLQAVKRVKIHKRATLTATVISPVGKLRPARADGVDPVPRQRSPDLGLPAPRHRTRSRRCTARSGRSCCGSSSTTCPTRRCRPRP